MAAGQMAGSSAWSEQREIGYVVVEFNQASGQPSVVPGYLETDDIEALRLADHLRSEAAKVGRRERYAVGTVTIEEED